MAVVPNSAHKSANLWLTGSRPTPRKTVLKLTPLSKAWIINQLDVTLRDTYNITALEQLGISLFNIVHCWIKIGRVHHIVTQKRAKNCYRKLVCVRQLAKWHWQTLWELPLQHRLLAHIWTPWPCSSGTRTQQCPVLWVPAMHSIICPCHDNQLISLSFSIHSPQSLERFYRGQKFAISRGSANRLDRQTDRFSYRICCRSFQNSQFQCGL